MNHRKIIFTECEIMGMFQRVKKQDGDDYWCTNIKVGKKRKKKKKW